MIVFIDSGDTLIDEASQIFIKGELVETAEYIPGGKELLIALKEKGYKVFMVADGLRQSFINVHKVQHDVYEYFNGHIYSEDVGICKPDARMFQTALKMAGLTQDDAHRVVMVGNNLSRDIKGANEMGMVSVHIKWSTRYPSEPEDESEISDFTIKEPLELLGILEELETR